MKAMHILSMTSLKCLWINNSKSLMMVRRSTLSQWIRLMRNLKVRYKKIHHIMYRKNTKWRKWPQLANLKINQQSTAKRVIKPRIHKRVRKTQWKWNLMKVVHRLFRLAKKQEIKTFKTELILVIKMKMHLMRILTMMILSHTIIVTINIQK